MKHFYKLGFILLALPLFGSCDRSPQSAPVQSAPAKPAISGLYKSQQTDNIHETLLRSVVPRAAKICYVSFGTRDPSSAFVKRMQLLKIPIEKMSLSPQPFERGRGAELRIKNPMLSVRAIQWISATKVEVVCDWPNAGTRYTLVQTNGKWAVASQRKEWIS